MSFRRNSQGGRQMTLSKFRFPRDHLRRVVQSPSMRHLDSLESSAWSTVAVS